MSTDILGYSYEVIDSIVNFADITDLPPVCLLALGLQESNLNPDAIGDVSIGGSYGVFQIYVAAHGGPPSRWQGLDGLMNAMREMVDRWHIKFDQHGGWAAVTSDLVAFQQAWSPDAQGSISWSEPMARARVSLAVALYTLYLKQQTAPEPVPDPHANDFRDALTMTRDGLNARIAGIIHEWDALVMHRDGLNAVLARAGA